MIVLGIDGSTTSTGVAVLEAEKEEVVKYGKIRVVEHRLFLPQKEVFTKKGNLSKTAFKALHAKERKEAMDRRVLFMMESIDSMLSTYKLDRIVVEDSYGQNDIKTTKMLSRIHGDVIGWARREDVSLKMKPPSVWRKEVGIPLSKDKHPLKRDEFKRLAKEKVLELFGIEVSDDEADAILIALSGFSISHH